MNSYKIDKGIPFPTKGIKINKYKSKFDGIANEMKVGDSIKLYGENDVNTLRMALSVRGKSSMRRIFKENSKLYSKMYWRMWVTDVVMN